MIIYLDTQFLIAQEISTEQYMLCYLLLYGNDTNIIEYSQKCKKFNKEDIDALEAKGFIMNVNPNEDRYKLKGLVVTETFKNNIYADDNNLFEELIKIYPESVKGNGSIRRLQTDKEKCRKKYASIVKGNIAKHKHILACLQYELNERKISNSMLYMSMLSTWLNQKGWEVYEKDLKEFAAKHSTNKEALDSGNFIPGSKGKVL